MLINQKQIVDRIIENTNIFNNGFHGLVTDHSAEMMISSDGQTQIPFGIDDRFGNYFYLRNEGSISIQNGPKIIEGDKSLEIRNIVALVANVKDADPEKLLECILNVLGTHHNQESELAITSAYITNERVIVTEFPFLKTENHLNILSRLYGRTLIKVMFSGYTVFQPRECSTCNPCIDC